MFLIYDTKKIWPWKNASMIKKRKTIFHTLLPILRNTVLLNDVIQSST